MTSSNGTIFRVTGPLRGESTGDRWIPLTEASDRELWCFLWSAPEQSRRRWFDTPFRSLCRHYNAHRVLDEAATHRVAVSRFPSSTPSQSVVILDVTRAHRGAACTTSKKSPDRWILRRRCSVHVTWCHVWAIVSNWRLNKLFRDYLEKYFCYDKFIHSLTDLQDKICCFYFGICNWLARIGNPYGTKFNKIYGCS